VASSLEQATSIPVPSGLAGFVENVLSSFQIPVIHPELRLFGV
jgi:hypothetical protein